MAGVSRQTINAIETSRYDPSLPLAFTLAKLFRLRIEDLFDPEDGAKAGVTFENTSETEPLVCLRYFGPEVNPDAPALGAYRKNKF